MEWLRIGIAFILITLMTIPGITQTVSISLASEEYSRSCTVPVAAVSPSGGGVLGRLTVKISYPGSGKVYISTSPASEVDTQGSARIAAFAASLLAGVDMLDYDFYYDIESPSIIIGGPSAGSAMALATYQLLIKDKCTPGIVATGMIQPDTSIGPVGGLKEKLEATANGGNKVFVIPAGQEVYRYVVRKVERAGPLIRIIEEPVSVDLREYGEKLGVRVVSASTLEEAYKLGVLGENESNSPPPSIELPSWIKEKLEEYITELNSSYNRYTSSLGEVDSRYIRMLLNAARSHASRSQELIEEGSIYAATVEMVLAVMTVEEAYAVSYALNNNLDVTVFVDSANETLNKAWDKALSAVERVKYSVQADSLIKAYAKIGLASYYYSQGIKELVESNGGYRLPYSLISGVDPSGVEDVVTAKWLANWSMLWVDIATSTEPRGVELDWERVDTVSRLLLAQAKTTTAYVEALLQESGARSGGEVSAYLADLAMSSSDNPLAVIGLAIESIAESTRIIHEVFTLDPSRTESSLENLAYRIASNTGNISLQPVLLLESALHSNRSIERLLTISRAILYGWAISEITGAKPRRSVENKEITETTISTTITTETSTATTTITNTITTTKTIQASPRQEMNGILTGLLVGFILGIAVYWAANRKAKL